MSREEYAPVGDERSAALIGHDGSVDWLCWPRFDSPAIFTKVLGTAENGFWKIAPATQDVRTTWAYRDASLVLETRHVTAEGEVLVTDFMPVDDGAHLVRLVSGVRGRAAMAMEIAVRFDYGSAVPWVSRSELGDLRAIAGPNKTVLRTDALHGTAHKTIAAKFTIGEARAAVSC